MRTPPAVGNGWDKPACNWADQRPAKNDEAAIDRPPVHVCLLRPGRCLPASRPRGTVRQAHAEVQGVEAEGPGGQRERTQRFDDEGEVRRTAAFSHAAAGRVYADHGAWAKAEPHRQRAASGPQGGPGADRFGPAVRAAGADSGRASAAPGTAGIEPQNPLHAALWVPSNCGPTMSRPRNDRFARPWKSPRRIRSAMSPWPTSTSAPARPGGSPEAGRAGGEPAPVAPNYALLATVCQRLGDLPAAVAAVDALALAPATPES